MLYETVSEGRRPGGLDHWMPLLHEKLDSLFDYICDAPLLLDSQVEAAATERFAQIKDYYDARRTAFRKTLRIAITSRCRPTSFISARKNSRKSWPRRRRRNSRPSRRRKAAS